MSVYGGPDTARDGLILNLDFGNIKCYSGAGNNCFDLSNSQLIGELGVSNLFMPVYNSVINNKYFSFNGTTNNRLIRIPNSTLLDTQTPSVEVWIKTNATTQNGFWFEKGNVNTQYSLFQNSNTIIWRHWMFGLGISDLSVTTSSYITTTSWYQVVGTRAASSKKIYINGVTVADSSASTGTIATNTGGMSIGVYGGYNGGRSYYYNGDIAIVKVYNKVLSANEVLNNFNALKGRFGL